MFNHPATWGPCSCRRPRIVTYFGGGLVVGGVATLLRRSVQVRLPRVRTRVARYPHSWFISWVYFMGNPNLKWMTGVFSPMYGNQHILVDHLFGSSTIEYRIWSVVIQQTLVSHH